MQHPLAALVLLAFALFCPAHAFFPISFQFDWKPLNATNRIPITAQCETLHITWSRCSFCTGPDPIAPYFLQLYTSLSQLPLVLPAGAGVVNQFDFTVPFPPNTLYQACMVDSVGNSGGCLDQYTVIPSSEAVDCANITFPSQYRQLNVQMTNSGSNLSTNGFPAQCSDIDFNIRNGKPPYTLTISPSLHPPLNITSNKPKLSWQVSLSWGTNFWVSVADSMGFTWTAGPLHSGMGRTECLALKKVYTRPQVAGVAVGSLLAGSLAVLVASIAFFTLRNRRSGRDSMRNGFVQVTTTYPISTPTASPLTIQRSPTIPGVDLSRPLPAVPVPRGRRSTIQPVSRTDTTQTLGDSGYRHDVHPASAPVIISVLHAPELVEPPPGYTTGLTESFASVQRWRTAPHKQ